MSQENKLIDFPQDPNSQKNISEKIYCNFHVFISKPGRAIVILDRCLELWILFEIDLYTGLI